MIEVKVTDDMFLQAREKSIEMGKLRNSILHGNGNLAGFIGEYLANSILKGTVENTFDYDIVLTDGTLVDVKTKQTTVKPLDYYECSVAKFNPNQKCDKYAFVRVKKDFSVGWFLGIIGKEDYFKKAKFLKKGEKDGDNGFTVRADCFNLKINELSNEDF